MQMARSKFGRKASLEVALRTNSDQRSGERWLAGKSMEAERLADLIRSDIGDGVLGAIMGADVSTWPDWYVRARRQMKLSTLRRTQAELAREMEMLERESGR